MCFFLKKNGQIENCFLRYKNFKKKGKKNQNRREKKHRNYNDNNIPCLTHMEKEASLIGMGTREYVRLTEMYCIYTYTYTLTHTRSHIYTHTYIHT